MIKTKVIGEREFVFVEVPADSNDPDIINSTVGNEKAGFSFFYGEDDLIGIVRLPKGKYQIIGKASELSEEDWKGIIPELNCRERWGNYLGDYPIWFHTAKESGLSLLKLSDLNPSTTLILEKLK